jgi:hypothetical protein
MTDALQTAFTAGLPVLAVLIGIVVTKPRMSDLRSHSGHRFDALEQILDARFAEQKAGLLRVEQVMAARLRRLERDHWPKSRRVPRPHRSLFSLSGAEKGILKRYANIGLITPCNSLDMRLFNS